MRLHVDISGEGPVLCFLHGFGGSGRNFRPQVRALRADHTVVTFDARGHARSEAPLDAHAYELDAFLDDIERVLDDCGAETATLVGVSMGAALALLAAARTPERVTSLVLASIPPNAAPDTWASPLAGAIERRGLEAAGAEFIWGGGRFDPGAASLIRKGFLEHSPHALVATLRRVLCRLPDLTDVARRVATLSIPQLYVAGEDDGPSVGASRQLAAQVPQARLVLVPGAGHVVNLQAPERFNALVGAFLSNCG